MNINNISIRPLSWAKRIVVKSQARAVRVPIGLYRGLVLELDLANQMQEYLGLHERETHKYILAAARRAGWMIDVGAGKGELSAYFLKRTSCSVIAVEPQPSDVAVFKRTVDRNDLNRERLRIIQSPAGSVQDRRSVRLDRLDVDVRHPGFIKIDVDGKELEVLTGTEELVDKCDVDFLVEVHSAYLERQTLEFFRIRNYDPVVVPNAIWRVILPEHRPLPLNRWVAASRRGAM